MDIKGEEPAASNTFHHTFLHTFYKKNIQRWSCFLRTGWSNTCGFSIDKLALVGCFSESGCHDHSLTWSVVDLMTRVLSSGISLDIKGQCSTTTILILYGRGDIFHTRDVLCHLSPIRSSHDPRQALIFLWFLIKGNLDRLELFPILHKVRVFA